MHKYERYKKEKIIQEGAYGVIWKSLDKETNQYVALKQCSSNDITTQRELKAFQSLNHPHIIRLLDFFTHSFDQYFVLELASNDLQTIISNEGPQNLDFIRKFMKELFETLDYIHSQGFIHRDIKTSNIVFIDSKENMKLIDFGLCRPIDGPDLTPNRCTYQYEPLDCLLGFDNYNQKLDIWSAGCIFGELILGKPLFNGDGQLQIVIKIIELLGTPNVKDWPESSDISYFQHYQLPEYPRTLEKVVPPNFDPLALDLLSKCLEYSQSKRITAAEALKHPFFESLKQ